MRHFATGRKILLSIAALGAAGTLASVGAFATFTSEDSATQSVSAGTVEVSLSASETVGFGVAATNVAPGDTVSRPVTLTNSGSLAFGGVTFDTTADPSSLLDTDTEDGLQLQVLQCTAAWAGAPTTGYTCADTSGARTVFASAPVIQDDAVIGVENLGSGGVNNLLVRMSLPQDADNDFQGESSTVEMSFTATQRTGTNR